MKIVSFVLLSITITLQIQAQTQWDYSQYKKVDFTNFSKNPLFLQEFNVSKPDYPLLNAVLFFMINEQRVINGVLPLEHHFALEITAYNHAVKMVEQVFFSHKNPNTNNRYDKADRGKLAGIANPSFAENIAYNYLRQGYTYIDIGDMFFAGWMNSPGHKSNILSKNGLQAGCGTYVKGDAVYAVQVFQWFEKVTLMDAVDKLPLLKDGSVPVVEH